MMRQAKSSLPEEWVLPLSWSKNTPGERCIWDTITRSVPFTINVPLGVIRGMSPMNTSCSLMSLTDFRARILVHIKHDQTQGDLQRRAVGHVALLAFLNVVFGFSSSYLTYSSTESR